MEQYILTTYQQQFEGIKGDNPVLQLCQGRCLAQVSCMNQQKSRSIILYFDMRAFSFYCPESMEHRFFLSLIVSVGTGVRLFIVLSK